MWARCLATCRSALSPRGWDIRRKGDGTRLPIRLRSGNGPTPWDMGDPRPARLGDSQSGGAYRQGRRGCRVANTRSVVVRPRQPPPYGVAIAPGRCPTDDQVVVQPSMNWSSVSRSWHPHGCCPTQAENEKKPRNDGKKDDEQADSEGQHGMRLAIPSSFTLLLTGQTVLNPFARATRYHRESPPNIAPRPKAILLLGLSAKLVDSRKIASAGRTNSKTDILSRGTPRTLWWKPRAPRWQGLMTASAGGSGGRRFSPVTRYPGDSRF